MFKDNVKAIQWLISVSKGNRVFVVLSILFAIGGGCVSMLPFLFFHEMVQAMFSSAVTEELVTSVVMGTAGAILLRYIFVFSANMCSHRAAFDIQCNLRKDLFAHVGKLPLGVFDKNSSGLLRKIISEDVESLEIYIAHHIPDTFLSLTMTIVIVGIIFTQHTALPTVLVIPVACMLLALNRLNQLRKDNVKEYFDNAEVMNSATVEYLRAIPIIKIFNVTVESFTKFHNSIQKQISLTSQWIKKSSPFFVLFKSSLDLILPLLLFVIAFFMYAGSPISGATYLLCFILGAVMVKPINQIYTSSNILCSLMEGASRVEQIMQKQPVPEVAHPLTHAKNFAIQYEDVSFGYGETTVLHNVNLNLKENGLYAFIGESGSGKTTAARLLLRFWDASSGRICIGGQDNREYSIDFLLNSVAFASQDPFILDGTIKDNICMGQEGINDEEIVRAATIAEAHGFVESLPLGYETIIGAHGTRLSGGEKQRISLARALVKNAPVLLLDEPTSQVDSAIERRIFEAIKRECTNQVVIFITHRIATAVNADTIFLFNQGHIVANGHHDVLVEENELYRRMWGVATRAGNWSLEVGS
ncbi:ABC transporter ATP-binding protein [Halodesulfovibrio sp.]|jgi:ATP-binding cassette subfamily B protein|uniref:ABC transporter ATP-binding protein n=1 Tax=Halodesulfovibrio sp. TaxID=1912772 RepID=UPI0025E1B2A4|nr:ABC transporter ATP-binding protein [Halodesulfovibrio sp.]MCT4626412.1 ABC transporter ATP-binding protein/permease [Halodesulfovibrio sp.]